jgi:hypothetical protein
LEYHTITSPNTIAAAIDTSSVCVPDWLMAAIISFLMLITIRGEVQGRPFYFLNTAALGGSAPPGSSINMQAIFAAAIVQRIDVFAINNLTHQSRLLCVIETKKGCSIIRKQMTEQPDMI